MSHVARAQLLLSQSRYDMAMSEAQKALAENPDNAYAHAMLSLSLSGGGKHDQALASARQAVGLAPDNAYMHYVLAAAYSHKRRWREARQAIDQAIRIEPFDADYQAMLANILLNAQRWDDALEAANRGLEIDAEHVECLNLRAMALTKLGRNEEARQSLGNALARSPENSDTHANQGWTLLHQSKPKQALEHFREALRLNPQNAFAQQGMLYSLKAHYLIYRLLLNWFLFMSRLSSGARTGIIIGLYVLARLLRGVADQNPDLQPYVWPILGVYLAFVLLTWIGEPLFNLLLRFNKYGRYALSAQDRTTSNWFAGLIVAAMAAVVVALIASSKPMFYLGGLFAVMTLPVTHLFGQNRDDHWPMKAAAVALLGAIGLAGVAAAFAQSVWASFLGGAFALGFFLMMITGALKSARSPEV